MSRKKQAKSSLARNRHFVARRQEPSLGFEHLEPRLALAVTISEFLADNTTGQTDFSSEHHDWIELKNTGPATVDVSGWYLTDDTANLTKWQIPATAATQSLDPGERLLVFASDKNGVFSGELHTNFKLATAGEYLGLVMSDGVTVAYDFGTAYPTQYTDVSFGTGADAGATATETLINTGSPATYRPFTGPNQAVDDNWLDINYDDSAWSTTTTGVGWNTDGGTEYTPYLPNPIPQFTTPNVSAYIRVPFTVTNKAQLTSMNLDLIADNAYIAFLNGKEVQRARMATDWKIGYDWELNSRVNVADSVNVIPDVIDLTAWLDYVVEGENVLCIYGANHTSQLGDFLIHPKLTAERATGVATSSYMITPTPGSENGAGWDGLVGDTSFSHHRGFYNAAFNLTISTPTTGATIRYTTDGSLPTMTNGLTYTGAIDIDPNNITSGAPGVVTLRTAAFKDGFVSTDVDTQSYVFLDKVIYQNGTGLPAYTTWGHAGADWGMDPDIVNANLATIKGDLQSIPTMSVVMDWEELFGNGTLQGIYTEATAWKEKSDERGSSLEYFTPDGSEEFQVDAAIEIQGHSSAVRWRSDKLSFQVKFKAPYDTKLETATLLGNSAIDGANAASSFDTLVLDAQYNYTWFTNTNQQYEVAKYINDQVVADLHNLAGGYSPHGRWVHLYINGLYWGIYDAHERPDDSFADEYFGGQESDYYAVKATDGIVMTHGGTHPEYLQVDGGLAAEQAYANLLQQVQDVANAATPAARQAQYAEVESLLDIDEFINYMAVCYYGGNYDWGQDNWHATFNHVAPNGLWRFSTWDQEHSFPTDDNLAFGETTYNKNYDSTTKNDTSGPTGIQYDLMTSEEYRLRFADRVQELMYQGGVLTPSAVLATVEARVNELDRAIVAESARWGDNRVAVPFTRQDWLDNIYGTLGPVQDFIPYRTDIVAGQFDTRGWIPTLDAPLFSQYGGEIPAGTVLTLSKPAGSPSGSVIYYTLDGSDPRLTGGGVSPTALAYTGGITLNASTQVQARIFFDNTGTANDWSPVVDKTFLLDQPYPLRIVELYYHPETVEEHEFIELLNTGSTTISLDNVQISSFTATPFTFASGLTLAAGQRIVVARNPVDFQARFGTGINLAPTGYAEANLSNTGEPVSLLGPFNEPLQAFTYDDIAPWQTSPDGSGYSLEYVGPLSAGENPNDGAPADPFDVATNWRASFEIGGSPGTDGEPVLVDSADFNADNMVNGLDFLAWQRGFGSLPAAKSDGDADNDADADAADLTIWQSQYGAAPPTLVSALSVDSVSASLLSLADANVWMELPTQQIAKSASNLLGEVADEYNPDLVPTDEAFAQFDGGIVPASCVENFAASLESGDDSLGTDAGELGDQLDAEVVALL